MDIKDLNKTQVILLCLLVAFVSSIATGITVVRLMTEQIASSTSQPVNRIIRQTIERVVSPKDTNTTPVVVSEEALLVSAIETVSPYVVSIKRTTGEEAKNILGTVLENSIVVIDANAHIEGSVYMMEIGETPLPIVFHRISDGIAYFTFTPNTTTETAFSKKPVLVAKVLPKSGQTVFGFDGLPLTVVRGTVSRIVPATEKTSTTILTTLTGRSLFSGTPIVDTAGAIVGIGLVSEGEVRVVSSVDILTGMKK